MGYKAASGYLGGLVYKDLFLQEGHHVKFCSMNFPALDSRIVHPTWFLKLLYYFGFRLLLVLIQRIGEFIHKYYLVALSKRYDVVCLLKIQSESFVRMLKAHTDTRVVLFFGDAIWLTSPDFSGVVKRVDAVATDNEYTASYVNQFNSSCHIINDYPQLDEFDKHRGQVKKSDDGSLVLGWIGSPDTAYNLYEIWAPLERLFSQHPNLHLRLVGAGTDPRLIPRFERVRFSILPFYSHSEMIDEILRMDIGLFPLQNIERSRVRGILKACVYMSGGAVVVASPIGQVAHLIKDGVNGMLAGGSDEWEQKLELLVSDERRRRNIADEALRTIRANFTKKQCYDKLMVALDGQNYAFQDGLLSAEQGRPVETVMNQGQP